MVEESRFESSASFQKWTFINVQKRKAENSFKIGTSKSVLEHNGLKFKFSIKMLLS